MSQNEYKTSKRLFVGVKITDGIRERFEPILKKLRVSADKSHIEVKWTQPQNFHITLMFLGSTEAEKFSQIEQSLEVLAKATTTFSINISGMGAFPNEHHARVLWIAAQRKIVLVELQQKLEAAMLELGFPKEEQEFQPHITFGKIRNTRSVKDLLSPFVRKDFGSVTVDRLVLFESQVQNNFSVYIPVKEFFLS